MLTADSFADPVAPAHRRSESKERPAKRPRIAAEQQERCSSCQEHFSRSRFPEQLAFLAWLFYWALERSVPGSPVAFTETHDAQSEERPAERPRLGAEQQERCGSLQEVWTEAHGALPADENHRSSGKRWTSNEIDYLKELWIVEKRPMSEVVSQFSRRFPGRSKGATRVFCYSRLRRSGTSGGLGDGC